MKVFKRKRITRNSLKKQLIDKVDAVNKRDYKKFKQVEKTKRKQMKLDYKKSKLDLKKSKTWQGVANTGIRTTGVAVPATITATTESTQNAIKDIAKPQTTNESMLTQDTELIEVGGGANNASQYGVRGAGSR